MSTIVDVVYSLLHNVSAVNSIIVVYKNILSLSNNAHKRKGMCLLDICKCKDEFNCSPGAFGMGQTYVVVGIHFLIIICHNYYLIDT